MAFCVKCGTQVEAGVNFCPNCGAQMGNASPTQGDQNQQYQQNPQYQQYQQNGQFQQNGQYQQGYYNNGPVYTNGNPNQGGPGQYSPLSDAQENKAMGVLAYLGILVFIPIFAAPKSKFARFHANQGLVLLIAEAAFGIIQGILVAILSALFTPSVYDLISGSTGRGAIYGILVTILNLVWILFIILVILGIVNAVNGHEKELPIIGKIKILK